MSVLSDMSVTTGIASSDLARIIVTAPRRYKVYTIPKRRGGTRIIAQPSRELKVLQWFLIERYLKHYPVHEAAIGYVKGKNIFENAARHLKGNVILKLDFLDFFPSIKTSDWKSYVRTSKRHDFTAQDVAITSLLLFWGAGTPIAQCLSIGAPTSPILSNILLFSLDEKLAQLAERYQVNYTRYADDITVSGINRADVLAFEAAARREIARLRSPRLTFNDEKRGVFSKGERRMVTGLVITPTGHISMGRERKRTISALLHRYSLRELDEEQIAQLKGLLGFSLDNEPSFVSSMRRKYGDELVDDVLRTHINSRQVRASNRLALN